MNAALETTRFGSGQAVRRVEDPALVQGQGCFTDDVAPEGQVFLRFVRSTAAHANLVSIDVEAARAMPGVLAVYTGADLDAAGVKPIGVAPAFKRADGQTMATPPKRPLAVDVVRFVGECVVAVVAETREAARAAADAVLVDYEDLPAVVDALSAMKPGAPEILKLASAGARGSTPCGPEARRWSAATMFSVPARAPPPASARNSR
jgi:carbon-monoxide dehydrogenase large subunit